MNRLNNLTKSLLYFLPFFMMLLFYGCGGDGGGGDGQCVGGCPAGATCVSGQCLCPSGQQVCNNACVNVLTDANHCGGCGHPCPSGAPCVNGVCGCSPNQTKCGDTCVDLQTSNSNCGQCGNVCPQGATCVSGVCNCPSGQTVCDNKCVDTKTDKMYCGNCTTHCAEVQSCENGSCVCPGTKELCGDQCVDLQTDKLHCGNCSTQCAAAQDCVNGRCVCPSGRVLCGTECVDTQTNNNHCGECNHPCAGGFHCVAGHCESLGCEIVPDDVYEGPPNNDSCERAKPLPSAPEGAPSVTVSDASLHHQSGSLDQDWFTVYADEATHICLPGDPQCNFYFDISLTLPPSVDHTNYEFCVGVGNCPTLNPIFCAEEIDWNNTTHSYTLTLRWEGTCGLDDAWTFYVKVGKKTNDNNCDQYSLTYQFYWINEPCE